MGALSSFERRLSEIVERGFAKVFPREVEPVEIAAALGRECDARKVIASRRTMVPNTFVVDLGDADHARLLPYAEVLATELASMVREHAEEQRYSFAGPVAVRLAHDPGLDKGVFRVHAEVSSDGAMSAPSAPSAGSAGSAAPGVLPGRQQLRQDAVRAQPVYAPVDPPPGYPVAPPPFAPEPARRPDRSQAAPLAEARLVVSGSDRSFPLTGSITRIGRAHDVDLRLDDTAVSRVHTEIRRQPDGRSHLLVDLGSTNGTSVNGQRTQTVELRDGDRVEIGSSTLVYRAAGSRG